jgi:hypothetical protein
VGPERQPGAIVAGEHNQRFSVEAGGLQRIEDATRARVKLLNNVSINTCRTVSLKTG